MAGDPGAQRTAVYAGADFIAQRNGAGVGDDATVGTREDGETAREGGQRTYGIEFVLRQMQPMRAGLHAALQGMLQPDAKLGVARVQDRHAVRRSRAQERRQRCTQADVLLLQVGVQPRAQSLFELIQPLRTPTALKWQYTVSSP